MNEHLHVLTDSELDLVTGGWKECTKGAMGGGGPGLYPDYVDCVGGTVQDGIKAFVDGFERGKTGKGRPA
jgi:hypothetical protein